jgi:hypothetical protein
VRTPLRRVLSALFYREFSIKQCRNGALNAVEVPLSALFNLKVEVIASVKTTEVFFWFFVLKFKKV